MVAMERNRLLIGVTVVVFLVMVTFSLYHNISPYTSVSKLVEMGDAKNVQVVGDIVKGSMEIKDGKTYFRITDGKTSVEVIYSGQINYYEGQVVVVGEFRDGKVYAAEVLRKCHTEYKLGDS